MHPFRRGMVELAVRNAGTGTHALYLAGADNRTVAHTVLVFQRTFQDIGDDLHVTVGMSRKTFFWLDPVLIDNPQLSEAHMFRIVITGEGEGVVGIQPAMIGMSPFSCFS